MLALLWALLSCQPAHAVDGVGQPHGHLHAHAPGASAAPDTAGLGVEVSVSVRPTDCDGHTLATALRRDGHAMPALPARLASAADVVPDLRAGAVYRSDPPDPPAFHALEFSRPLRI